MGWLSDIMGNGSDSAEQVQITAEEQQAATIASDRWNRYVETGVPVQNEFIARTTGIRIDSETGDFSVEKGGNSPLNQDGSIRTDATDSNTAFEKSATQQLMNGDPNRSVMSMQNEQRGMAGASANSSRDMQMQQQGNYLQSVDNVARIGQGVAAENLSTQAQLAGQAQSEAITAAGQAQALRQETSQSAGMVAGAVGSGIMRKYENQKTDTSKAVTDRLAQYGGYGGL